MKQMSSQTQQKLKKDFARLKLSLKPGVVEGIRTAGFREAMLEEYRELAHTASDLIAFLGSLGFQEALDDAGKDAFAELMARFSVCGQRIQIVIEESNDADQETFLALSAPASQRVH